MPTKRVRRSRDWRPELSSYQTAELLTGEVDYSPHGYTGYGDGVGKDLAAFITDEMRNDSAQHRDKLLAFWVSGEWSCKLPGSLPWLFYCGAPGTRPWAFWQLENGPPVGENESTAEYLIRCGLWLPGEREAFEARHED